MKKKTFVYIFLAFIATIALLGCKAKKSLEYVPVPEYHWRTEEKTDSVNNTDSVSESTTAILQEVDSSYLAELGIIKPPSSAWLLRETHDKREKSSVNNTSVNTITLHDSVPVPYPVEVPVEVATPIPRWIGVLACLGLIPLSAFVIYIVCVIRRLMKEKN